MTIVGPPRRRAAPRPGATTAARPPRAQRGRHLGMELLRQVATRAARRCCAACMTSRSSSRPACRSASQGSMSRTTAIPCETRPCCAASTRISTPSCSVPRARSLHDRPSGCRLAWVLRLRLCRLPALRARSRGPGARGRDRRDRGRRGRRGIPVRAPGSSATACCARRRARAGARSRAAVDAPPARARVRARGRARRGDALDLAPASGRSGSRARRPARPAAARSSSSATDVRLAEAHGEAGVLRGRGHDALERRA